MVTYDSCGLEGKAEEVGEREPVPGAGSQERSRREVGGKENRSVRGYYTIVGKEKNSSRAEAENTIQ